MSSSDLASVAAAVFPTKHSGTLAHFLMHSKADLRFQMKWLTTLAFSSFLNMVDAAATEACAGVECDGTVGLMVLQNAAHKSRTTHLLEEHEVSPESVNTSRKELTEIQVRNVKVLRKKQLHDLEKEIGGLELQAKNNSKNNASGPSVGDRKKLSDLITLLTTTFEQQLYTENSDDQGTYNIKKAQHQSCINNTNERFGVSGDVAAAWRRYGTKKPKHKSCRKTQKSLQNFVDAAGVVDGRSEEHTSELQSP